MVVLGRSKEDVQTLRERDKTIGVLFIPRFMEFSAFCIDGSSSDPSPVCDLRRVQYRRLLDRWSQECFGRVGRVVAERIHNEGKAALSLVQDILKSS